MKSGQEGRDREGGSWRVGGRQGKAGVAKGERRKVKGERGA